MGSTVSRLVSRKQQEEEEYCPPASEDYVDDYDYEDEQDDKTWLHEKFFNLIAGSKLAEQGTLVINILQGDTYYEADYLFDKGTETCLLYDITDTDRDFLQDLRDRLKNKKLNYNIVEATERNIWIGDQQDFYAAVVQHVFSKPDSLVMDVYISQDYVDNEEEEDKIYEKFLEETLDEGYLLAEEGTCWSDGATASTVTPTVVNP